MKINSPSKVNLYLRVVRKKSNGYHEIETVFYPVHGLSDTISLLETKNNCLKISSTDPDLPCDARNLCWKAAASFAKFADLKPNWHIRIEKNIPVSAGLGGGSSNAAAILKLLDRKYTGLLSEKEIRNIAVKIGADVAFFLNPVPSVAKGIGDKLKPIDINIKIPIVIVFPKFPVSAAWAYSNRISREKTSSLNDFIHSLESGNLHRIASSVRNDLSPALFKKFPFLRILKKSMTNSGALAVEVSGSGSSLFGITENNEASISICRKLKKEFGNAVDCYSK